MAFIKSNPRSDYTYYNVVETVYEEGEPRHNELLYIGRIDTLSADDRLQIERDLTDIDPSLVADFVELLLEHDYEFSRDEASQAHYPLEEIRPTKAVDYGPVAALHATAEKLALPAILEEHLQPKGGGPPLGDLLLIQIIARCLEPRSIDATAEWYPITALPGLLELSGDRVTADTFYNSLDYVTRDGIERIHDALWTRVHELYDTPETPLFYDLTSSYFEGTACPLAKYGHSSEHRPDKQQLKVGVTVNPDMVPLQHDVYTGETNDSTTVDEAATRIDALDVPEPILVMDKGCAPQSTLERLRGDGPDIEFEPIDYVAVLKNYSRVTDPLSDHDSETFEPVDMPEGASPLAVKELPPGDDLDNDDIRWIATYNEDKAADDAAYRDGKLDEAAEALDELVEKQYSDDALSKDDLLGKIDSKVPSEVDDLLRTEVNERGPPRLSWELDEEAVAEAAKLDGKAMFETTRAADQLSAASVARAYRDRDTVEKFMESIKDMAQLRPHYVYTEDHVKARVFICVLSVLLIAALQLELEAAGKNMTGLKALETLRGVRRVEFSPTGGEAVVVKTTELSDDQEQLAHVFDLAT